MIKSNIFLLMSFAILLAQSCTKDTCNDVPTFDTLTAVVATSGVTADVTVEWAVNKSELPTSYFDALFLVTKESDYYGEAWQNDHAKVDKVTVNGTDSFKLTLTEAAVQSLPKSFSLHFMLPDRREFIECTHPGSGDDYYLDISFDLAQKDNAFTIDNFQWTETLNAGGL